MFEFGEVKTVILEVSKCTKCGFCEVKCPTIQALNYNRLYGPRGRIQLINGLLRGKVKPSRETVKTIYTCLLCGGCSQACPAGIDVRSVVRSFRSLIVRGELLDS